MKKCIYSMFLLLAAVCMSTSCMKEVIYVDSPYQEEVNPGSRAINPDIKSEDPGFDEGGGGGRPGGGGGGGGSNTIFKTERTYYFDQQVFTRKIALAHYEYTVTCDPSNPAYPQVSLLSFGTQGVFPDPNVKFYKNSVQGCRIKICW